MMESPVLEGGGTGFLARLCKTSKSFTYDIATLGRYTTVKHRISTPKDVLDWCIE